MSRSASHIILSLAAALAALLAASCSADRCDWTDPESLEGTTYLSLRLYVSPDSDGAGTRAEEASEAPGEAPEGRLPGNAYENAIDNLTIFFARYDGDAIPENKTKIEFEETNKLYVDLKNYSHRVYYNDDGSRTVLIPLDATITVSSGEYSIVVVANHGDLRGDIHNLDELRTKAGEYAWSRDIDGIKKTGFVMSSFDVVNGGVMSKVIGDPHTGTKEDPYYSECTLMRLASRIDLCCSKESGGYGEYSVAADGKTPCVVYEAVNESGDESGNESAGTVYLLSAEPVNAMSKASYLLRHSYPAQEIGNLKFDQFPLSLICGGLMETDNKKEELNYIIDPNFPAKVENPIETTLDGWFGNSRPDKIKESYGSRFAGNSLVEKFITDDFSPEEYNKKKFDRSLTICYVNENTYKKTLNARDYATGLCFKTVFEPKTIYKYAPLDEDDEETRKSKIDSEYSYGVDFWHLRTADGHDIYFSSEDAAKSYKSKHPGVLTYHPGGVGYYHIWIRHSKVDSEDDDHVMKYGIVRNHIYRVLLTFKGPGFNLPFDSDIPNDVEWKIFTRDWNQREWNLIEVPGVKL